MKALFKKTGRSIVAVDDESMKMIGLMHEGAYYELSCSSVGPKANRTAKNLYHMWIGVMCKKFFKGYNKKLHKQMHTMMKHEHLGYEEVTISKTKLPHLQLKSTEDLNSAEMCFYMQLVDHWAADKECSLPRREDDEYSKYREAQQ